MKKTQSRANYPKRVFTLLIILLSLTAPALAAPWQGHGTESEPYLIHNANDLLTLGADPNYYSAHFKLTNDIDLSSLTFTTAIIAPPSYSPFTGTFDGNSYKITNLTINTNGMNNYYLGLFGQVGSDGQVTNLGVEDVNITGGDSSRNLGGLCGANWGGTITDCYTTGAVTGGSVVGGLCGINRGTITNCYATGSVTGDHGVGGLVGYNNNSFDLGYNAGGTITNCYATGLVTGNHLVGGLCGVNWGGMISNCFWDMETSGLTASIGGTGLTTAQMQTKSTFTDAGWKFGDPTIGSYGVWYMLSSGYPQLVATPFLDNIAWVPDVVRMSLSDAQNTISSAGFTVGNTYYVSSISIDNNKVAGISVCIGGAVYLGTTIDIYVSTGNNGDGSQDAPYPIACQADIDFLAVNVDLYNSNFVLTRNIYFDVNSYTTAIIAPDMDNLSTGFQGTSFTGVFDGNGCKIIALMIDDGGAGNDYLGLFGQVGSGGQIRNLGLEGGSVSGTGYGIGGLCGYNWDGTISNCYSTGSVTGGDDSGSLGGLCGRNRGGTISNCYSTGSVNGGEDSSELGGLCGENWYGTISNCYATGNVTGGDDSGSLGGLCGDNNYGTITDCYATGSVTGEGGVGGLVGYNSWNSTIAACYATGEVTGDQWVGGLVGSNDGTITACYATGEVTGDQWVGGLCGNNNYGTITDCYATGNVMGGEHSWFVGGLCGENRDGTISNCYATGSVTGGEYSWYLGGLCGSNNGIISNCYTTGSVTGGEDSWYLGGLCGVNSGEISNSYATGSITGGEDFMSMSLGGLCGGNSGTISNCYATGSVTGGDNSSSLGGLCGENYRGSISNCYSTGNITGGIGSWSLGGLCGGNVEGTIFNCYATGSVTGGDDSWILGGLCGGNREGTISNCFWDIETSGQTASDGGTGLTTDLMQTLTTFTDAGWDFTTPVWLMCDEGEYPKLWWQGCNTPPIAVAGLDRSVYAYPDGFADVTVDGSDSNDPDGDNLTYLWSWTIDGTTYDTNGINPTIELPVGEHIVTLIVNDGYVDSEPDHVTITVIEPVESLLRIYPRTLNRTSRGRNIIAFIQLPEGITKDQVSDEKVMLYPGNEGDDIEASRQLILGRNRNGAEQVIILALFDRSALLSAIPENGLAELEVTGKLTTGQIFYGDDSIRIIDPKSRPRPNPRRPRRRRR